MGGLLACTAPEGPEEGTVTAAELSRGEVLAGRSQSSGAVDQTASSLNKNADCMTTWSPSQEGHFRLPPLEEERAFLTSPAQEKPSDPKHTRWSLGSPSLCHPSRSVPLCLLSVWVREQTFCSQGTDSALPAPFPGCAKEGTETCRDRSSGCSHWQVEREGLRVPSQNSAVFSDGKDQTLPFAALESFGVLDSDQVLGVPKAGGPELGLK